jgi:phytoene/squalene synthetase
VNVEAAAARDQTEVMLGIPRSSLHETQTRSLVERARFHAPHLERVSRSFAYGISRLEPDLKAPVGLGYLICRILDTIEDAPWSSGPEQEAAFREFQIFLTDASSSPESLAKWAGRFPAQIPPGERLLIDDAPTVFAEFASLNAQERSAMLDPIFSMARGMTSFTERIRLRGELRLQDLNDVNTYCFFVAGVVGELLTGLLTNQLSEEMRPIGRESIWELATHFGLFLQKINVLKDQWMDEREGRFLVPDRAELLRSLHENATGAFRYLGSIPLKRKDYRLFCAWALFLGLATVPLIRASVGTADSETAGGPKISRLRALALGSEIERSILDPVQLQQLFSQLESAAWPVEVVSASDTRTQSPLVPSAATLARLTENYVGKMDVLALAQLLTQSPG